MEYLIILYFTVGAIVAILTIHAQSKYTDYSSSRKAINGVWAVIIWPSALAYAIWSLKNEKDL